ncbi:unnamed protein product, partial [Scytosiphon promiscuus]
VRRASGYDNRRVRALQNKRYRRSIVYQEDLKARKVAMWCAGRSVFQEQSSIVTTACWYCGDLTYNGYSGVDRMQNAGSYVRARQRRGVLYSTTCNFMNGSLSVNDFLRKVKYIARQDV